MPTSHCARRVIVASRVAATLLVTTLSMSLGCASTQQSGDAANLGAVYSAPTLPAGRYALVVFGMSCPKCISNVDLQLGKITGVAHPKVDMKHGIVTIDVPGPTEPSRDAIFQAILDAGFTLREIRSLPQAEVTP